MLNGAYDFIKNFNPNDSSHPVGYDLRTPNVVLDVKCVILSMFTIKKLQMILMKAKKYVILMPRKMNMVKKLIYCFLWSVALFVATFYGIIDQDSAFLFKEKLLLDVARSHIFPMIMAMVLYLWDVMYNVSLKKDINGGLIFWILGTNILFMGTFVFSLLVNNNFWGWTLFGIAWLSLTVLKYKTTEDEQSSPYIIPED